MNARFFSLYWDNIDPEIVAAQKSVFDAMSLPINQHRIHGLRHGEWIDWTMARAADTDVFLFIDIDCIPLNKDRVMQRLQMASTGTLVGAEGAANHLDPTRSYAGAWYVYIDRGTWEKFGRPSAEVTRQGDVCQHWADVWRSHNAPVHLIAPTHCVTPQWDLPGRPMCYGAATTYGDDCFHLFQARQKGAEVFLERCRKVIGGITV